MGTRAWWLSGRFDAVHPFGCRFKSHFSRCVVGTLEKSFTRNSLQRFDILTPNNINILVGSASE